MSTFVWVHSAAQQTNTWFVGIGSAAAAALAMRVPALRYVNAGLALWLFVSTWILPVSSAGTLWNNVLAALVMLVAALVPSPPEAAFRH